MREPPPGPICPDCGYDLRGGVGPRCPECGLDVAGLAAAPPVWEQRRAIGRVRAYVGTALQVMFRTRRFCRHVAVPVDERSAARFRLVTAGLALPIPVSLIWAALASWDDLRSLVEHAEWWLLAPWVVCALMAHESLTSVGSGLFALGGSEEEIRRRRIALGRYACAPLALGLIGVVALASTAFSTAVAGSPMSDAQVEILLANGLVPLFLFWAARVAVAASLYGRRLAGFGVGLGTLAAWAGTLALWLIIVPLLVFYWGLMIVSTS
ncbi:hypothetical protein RAS1_29570 [Phycisphaerae bacterium RAS1]|nr:hypothetical protein RAS1_29570 [Phycisphaerae bacterium RAS1]